MDGVESPGEQNDQEYDRGDDDGPADRAAREADGGEVREEIGRILVAVHEDGGARERGEVIA